MAAFEGGWLPLDEAFALLIGTFAFACGVSAAAL
jgi:hypothetical protein